MEPYSLSHGLWFCLNRLHRGRSGKSFSRSNSRNRSTSRVPLCHRNTPSDQQGGSSRHQPMNVALPNGQRPAQTKAEARGDMQGRPAAPVKTKELHLGENMWEPKAEGVCVHCRPCESRQSGRGRTRIITIKKTGEKNLKQWWRLMSTQLNGKEEFVYHSSLPGLT